MAVGRVVQTRLRLIATTARRASLLLMTFLVCGLAWMLSRMSRGSSQVEGARVWIALEWTSVMCIHLFHGLGLANVAHYVAAGHLDTRRHLAPDHRQAHRQGQRASRLSPRRRQPHHPAQRRSLLPARLRPADTSRAHEAAHEARHADDSFRHSHSSRQGSSSSSIGRAASSASSIGVSLARCGSSLPSLGLSHGLSRRSSPARADATDLVEVTVSCTAAP